MAYDVKHLYGVNVAPAFGRLSDEISDLLYEEHAAQVHRVYEREEDFWIIGVKVPVTERGIVVTSEIEAAAEAALRALPASVLEEIRSTMETHPSPLAVYRGTISEDEERAWRAGTIPAPRFHVCPYWG